MAITASAGDAASYVAVGRSQRTPSLFSLAVDVPSHPPRPSSSTGGKKDGSSKRCAPTCQGAALQHWLWRTQSVAIEEAPRRPIRPSSPAQSRRSAALSRASSTDEPSTDTPRPTDAAT